MKKKRMEFDHINVSMYFSALILVIAYIVRMVNRIGLPTFQMHHASSDGTDMIRFGTARGGFEIKSVVDTLPDTSLYITLSILFKGEEGKLLIMLVCLPFSLAMSVVCGIAADMGRIEWKVDAPVNDPTMSNIITNLFANIRRNRQLEE